MTPGSRFPVYDERERDYSAKEREGANVGLVRVDARELVRDAKARERRERGRDSYIRHSQSQAQLQPQRELSTSERARRRSASRSSGSSLSLDEMLLETATDRERERPSPPGQSAVPLGARQSQSQAYGVTSSMNGNSAPYGVSAPPMAKAPSVHAPPANANGMGRKSAVPAAQLMTLGPTGTIVSGGGGGESSAGAASVDPAVRFPGLRTCRQCGMPGRYKDGKCVEKWGPGPQGPGTVCDR